MMMKRLSLLLLVASSCSTAATSSSSSSDSLRRKTVTEEDEQLEVEVTDQTTGFIDEEEYIAALAGKLRPVELDTILDPKTNVTTLHVHQFLHLHHMKTGGTSMDGLLQCAMRRLKKKSPTSTSSSSTAVKMAYMNLHECGLSHYRSCRDDVDSKCWDQINQASILSYCAPLMDLETFGWTRDINSNGNSEEESMEGGVSMEGISLGEAAEATSTASSATYKPHAVTVLRHPVNRVWSMFRFQTKRCYQCRNLTDVFASIDAGDTTDLDEICLQQLLNHQTRNLVSSTKWRNSTEFNTYGDPDILLEEAISNMKYFFTMVGLTENMKDTATMVGMVFPFMNETYGDFEDQCPMPHKNASPENNRCGPDGHSHWDLPAHPDKATAAAIIAHNQLDIKLYEQAVQQFQYQKMALGLVDSDGVDGEMEEGDVPNQG
jgi:hypothetical protein